MGHLCTHWVRLNQDGMIANYFHTETPVDLDVWLKDWSEGTHVECIEALSADEARDLGNRQQAWKWDGQAMTCLSPRVTRIPDPPKPTLDDRVEAMEVKLTAIAAKLGV